MQWRGTTELLQKGGTSGTITTARDDKNSIRPSLQEGAVGVITVGGEGSRRSTRDHNYWRASVLYCS